MLNWLIKNLGNIFLSIVLAIVVWVVAVNEANPNREDTFNGIPVVVVNQPDQTVVYAASASTVSVRLSAPESTWSVLNARVISATVDLREATSGQALHAVTVNLPDALSRGVRVVRVDPASISLILEPLAFAEVPVAVILIGQPAPTYRLGGVVSQPTTATIRGPASWVSRVTKASSELSVQGVSAPLSQTVGLIPVDASGQEVPNVDMQPRQARLSVGVEQIAGFRDLTVKVELTGTQASGYRLVGVDVTPLSVTAVGAPATLATLDGFAATEPIDITGAKEAFEQDAEFALPPDVGLFGQQTVRVRIKIEPIVGSLTVPILPTPIDLAPNLIARVSPETVDVILEGPLPILDSIDIEQDVQVILDLAGLGLGTHQVEPLIETPAGVSVKSVLPPTVQVTIERAPRGTPTPSPTPRPTPRP